MNQCYNRNKNTLSHEDLSSEGAIRERRATLLASAVKAASTINGFLMSNCNICTVYCDRQVQYEEYVQQQYDVGTGAMGHLYAQLNNIHATPKAAAAPIHAAESRDGHNDGNTDEASDCDFVNPAAAARNPGSTSNPENIERTKAERIYREFLFDEESVVRSVGTRGGASTEEYDGGEDDDAEE